MKKTQISDTRSKEELLEHYHLEKRLADRLRNSNRKERQYLYSELYNELLDKIPYFHNRKLNKKRRLENVSKQVKFLENFLKPEDIFLEVGAGDCALSIQLCSMQQKVFGLDVVNQIPKDTVLPDNFEFVQSNGTNIDLPSESVDLVFSNQLMEHLHPQDAIEQIKNIYNCLRKKGAYVLLTPHRFTGPHDISKYFDDVATGFHLREYTNTELYNILKSAGFSKINYYTQLGKLYKLPIMPSIVLEKIMIPMSYSFRKTVFQWILFRHLLPIRLAAIK